ncbi:MAG: ribosomal RNA small subunit methyltransferase A [Chlamydiales bacterium]|nr:16S rRNA (adenine(1518)-N(6)/adenine(1519)-N(6))-dimethyltransferase RsmA [Chlamydiales bacterium]NCF70607.1 ribosomal RNA small subunit methyltransferase A [Chlamydiales bacterium]
MGQNFLINNEVLDRIIDEAKLISSDIVLEIGPGPGALTERLLTRVAHLYVIEKDDKLYRELKKRYHNHEKITLIHADALEYPINDLFTKHQSIKVVANLPYNVATPIIMRLIETPELFQGIFVMLQKEVAERICATINSKAYGLLSLIMQMQANTKLLFDIPKDSFFPPPKVTSSFIALFPELKDQLYKEEAFLAFLKTCFKQKRKTLYNNLKGDYSPEKIIEVFESLSLESKVRAEQISLDSFSKLYRCFASNT